jgi:hypothetical protein
LAPKLGRTPIVLNEVAVGIAAIDADLKPFEEAVA